MKETINYYYNFDIQDIEENDGKYHFKIDNNDYFFVFYNRDIKEFEDILICVNNMKKLGIDVHNIIPNINGSYLTKINECNYILLNVNNMKETYDIFDIVNIENKLTLNTQSSLLYRNNWHKLWSDKVDYFEYQIRQLAINKDIIKNSFGYYVGLAENAISYVDNLNKTSNISSGKIVLSHRRVFYPNYKLNFFNPLSFIFDLQVRDIAEYLKAMFFKEKLDETLEELTSYLKINKLNYYEYGMLYARLLYPSYYFDMYDEVLNKEKNEEDLIKIISKNREYELFLKKAYLEISKYAHIDKIDWLIY